MRFGCDFALIKVPSGTAVQCTGFLGAVRRLMWAGSDPSTAPCNGQEELSVAQAANIAGARGVPLVCFAEGVCTNGKSVISFAPVMNALPADTRVHVVGLEYSSGGLAPQSPLGRSVIAYLFWMCFQVSLNIVANLVPHELRTVETERSSSGEAPKPSNLMDDVRSTLATSIGNRGVKQTSLGIEQYFSFVEYYLENATISQRKKKKTN